MPGIRAAQPDCTRLSNCQKSGEPATPYQGDIKERASSATASSFNAFHPSLEMPANRSARSRRRGYSRVFRAGRGMRIQALSRASRNTSICRSPPSQVRHTTGSMTNVSTTRLSTASSGEATDADVLSDRHLWYRSTQSAVAATRILSSHFADPIESMLQMCAASRIASQFDSSHRHQRVSRVTSASPVSFEIRRPMPRQALSNFRSRGRCTEPVGLGNPLSAPFLARFRRAFARQAANDDRIAHANRRAPDQSDGTPLTPALLWLQTMRPRQSETSTQDSAPRRLSSCA